MALLTSDARRMDSHWPHSRRFDHAALDVSCQHPSPMDQIQEVIGLDAVYVVLGHRAVWRRVKSGSGEATQNIQQLIILVFDIKDILS